MFKLDSEQALLKAFRTRDRGHVEVTAELKFPLVVRHTFAWRHPAGGRVFLLFAVPGGAPTGIVFDTNDHGAAVPHLCHWCHCTGAGSEVGLLTARVSGIRTVGVSVCTDLGCKRKLEDEADRSGRSAVPAIAKLVERMGEFAHVGLGIDLYASGR